MDNENGLEDIPQTPGLPAKQAHRVATFEPVKQFDIWAYLDMYLP